MKELTYGEIAVGITFNPSANTDVEEIKRAYADIIDKLDSIRSNTSHPEIKRLMSVAITEAQTAQMRAVKGVTFVPQAVTMTGPSL